MDELLRDRRAQALRLHRPRAAAGRARLCPAFSLPDLFGQQAAPAPSAKGAAKAKPKKLTQAQVSGLLAAIPPYFSQDVITADRRVATLAFGIRLMSLHQQQQLIERCARACTRPAGVSAQLVGLPVLAAKSGAQVASPLAAPGDAAGGPGGRRAGAADRLPRRSPPRARAARADRARQRLVGADPVRRARAAEPDVGHAGRARDRDLHRVQRAAVRAPPPGARWPATTRSRRCAAATGAPARPSPPRE